MGNYNISSNTTDLDNVTQACADIRCSLHPASSAELNTGSFLKRKVIKTTDLHDLTLACSIEPASSSEFHAGGVSQVRSWHKVSDEQTTGNNKVELHILPQINF